MEIRIKTAEEFRDSHVTVTVKASDNDEAMRVVAALVGGPPAEGYNPDAAVDQLAENYQRARNQITELEADIARRVDNEKMVYRRLGDLEVRALDLGEALAAERRQADKSAIEVDKVMEELVKTRTERDQLRDKAAQKRNPVDLTSGHGAELIAQITALAFNGDDLDVVFTKPESVPDDYASLLFERLLEIRALLTPWHAKTLIEWPPSVTPLVEARRVIRQIAGLIARPGTREQMSNGDPDGNELVPVLVKINEVAAGYLQGVANQT